MGRNSVISREARQYIVQQVQENGIVTVADVANIVRRYYQFDGFSIGVALQRFLICSSVNSFTPTVCELCQWQEKRKERRKRRKSRH